ncbi:O-acyltransferase like protein-like [Gigantopelta aegis]|uniref:O-acyltransferase like protein-like n=1 Tax=Gigantopelta aegis TaxID=1735272 RepID=UPI001B88C724|nr:O-acyltransferase like protein-like [Gigantopelta aegis]
MNKHLGHSISEVFLCFAIQRNLERILGEGNPNYLFCLNGVRVLSITWIVLGNTVSFLYREPNVVANVVEVPEAAQRFVFQFVINATFAADTFFILSGTLLAYNWMKQEEKKNKFTVKQLLMMYFHRFVRIAPCYYVLIMTYTNLLPYFGEGPGWKYTSDSIRQCKDHWWANALFISNFYKADDMCMTWTYYLVNDFQFYLISPIVLIPLSRCPPLAFVLIILLVLTQIVTTAVFNKNINGNILRMTGGFFEDIYAKPYCRVGVFAIGIALGYAIYMAGRHVYFRKTPLVVGWCVALCTLSVVVFITYDENRVGGTHWTGTQTAVYEALSRPAWGLGVSWIIFCCCIGQGGIADKILSWNVFLPLCRITYGIYLLHPLLIVLIVDTSKTLIYLDATSVLNLFVFILVISMGLALMFMASVEGPIIRLETLLLH